MIRVTCINARSYSLTVGQEYDANESPRAGFYEVINDAGHQVNYSTDLFEEVPTESTPEQIIESIRVSSGNTNIIARFTMDGVDVEMTIPRLTIDNTSISCGIKQLYEMNRFTNQIISRAPEGLIQRGNVLQVLIDKIYEENVTTVTDCAMVLLSTNTNAENFERTAAAMNKIAVEEHDAVNPNSSNTIRLWVVDLTIDQD